MGIFSFFKTSKDVEENKKVTKQNSIAVLYSGEPIFKECKVDRTIIVGSKYKGMEILESSNKEEILIDIVANLFVTNWAKRGERCLKKILAHLIKEFIFKVYGEEKDDIDLKPILNSLDKNLDQIIVSDDLSKEEKKVLEKIYDRILYHRDNLFNSFFSHPEEFKHGWSELKDRVANIIENILKTKGDALLHVSTHYTQKYDKGI